MGKAEAVEERRKKDGARIAAGAKGAIEVSFNLASISAAIQSTEMQTSGKALFCGGGVSRAAVSQLLAGTTLAGGGSATKENRKEGRKRGRDAAAAG